VISAFIISGMLIIISIPFFMGKGLFLLPKYNSMTPKEKEMYHKKYDAKKICKATGYLLFSIAILIFIVGFYNSQIITLYCIATVFSIFLFYSTYINAGCNK